MTEPFRLQNDPPPKKPWVPPAPEETTQRVLFAGMDCLPGQLDLFRTDGEEEDA